VNQQEMLYELRSMERDFEPMKKLMEDIDCMFPLLMVYWKRKTKDRKGMHTHNVQSRKKNIRGEYNSTKRFKSTSKTKGQNHFNVITSVAVSSSDLGTINRIMKHRGYRNMVAGIIPNEAELEKQIHGWRYCFWKYKDFEEMYRTRGQFDLPTKDIVDRLTLNYPCFAPGQLKLL
jgi:hypothetical protein